MIALGLTGLTGLCLGLVLLYHQLLTSSYFSIKTTSNINIEGTQRLSPEMVLQLGKLGPETTLLALRAYQVEQALTQHPWIARAELTRKWPNRLHLRIKEREPVALVQVGELYYVDRQGHLFKPLSPGDPHDFPVITGLTREHFPQTADRLPEVLAQVFQFLELLKQSSPPLNQENVSEVHVDLERGFSIYLNGLPGAVELGWTDFPEKMQKFSRIWPILSQKKYLAKTGRINLDYPQRVLLSLKGVDENQ